MKLKYGKSLINKVSKAAVLMLSLTVRLMLLQVICAKLLLHDLRIILLLLQLLLSSHDKECWHNDCMEIYERGWT